MYCAAYSQWRHAEKVLTETPAIIKCDSGAIIQNPAIAIRNRSMSQMDKFGKRLGYEEPKIKSVGRKPVASRDRSGGKGNVG